MKTNNHGDLILYPIDNIKIPKTAKGSKKHILQDSGVTGNRHEIVSKKSLIYRWTDKDGIEYISCKEDYKIQHVGGDCEHGEQVVEAGTRKVLHEMEWNPWENELKVVID
jgi:hypothetical protein